jgi:organic radical activating enzyme
VVKAAYERVRRLPGVGKLAERFAQRFSLDYVERIRHQLNAISPTICAAKWLQSTVHLEIGETHSCHHPQRHKIPVSELLTYPGALHDTQHKKAERKKMLAGERPAECSYCWKIEDLPDSPLSDRHYKSAEDWARPFVSKLENLKGHEDIAPTYLELSFSSNCQMKCSYCDPSVSSALRAEIKKFGPYPTTDLFGTLNADHDGQVYNEAFWKWWPEVRSKLKVFRLTGGEPLLEEDTFRVMESFLKDPMPNLKFSVNSNLMIAEDRFRRFLDLLKMLSARKSLKELQLFVSIDTWGEQAEWLRFGLKLPTFCKNLEAILDEAAEINVTLMITFNALSPFRFKELLDYVIWCRQTYPRATLRIGVAVLHNPAFMSLDVLPKSHMSLMTDLLEHHKKNDMQTRGRSGFTAAEIAKFERLLSWWSERPTASERWPDLKTFVAEYDRRKGTDFEKAFPGFLETLR